MRVEKNKGQQLIFMKGCTMSEQTYVVSGMTCQHCVARVQTTLSAVAGVDGVRVQLMPPRAVVSGSAPLPELQNALAGTSFKIEPMN